VADGVARVMPLEACIEDMYDAAGANVAIEAALDEVAEARGVYKPLFMLEVPAAGEAG